MRNLVCRGGGGEEEGGGGKLGDVGPIVWGGRRRGGGN